MSWYPCLPSSGSTHSPSDSEHGVPTHRAMVVKDCWHKCPIFYIIISTLKDFNDSNHFVILLFLTEVRFQGVLDCWS